MSANLHRVMESGTLFDEEFLRKLEYLKIVSGRLIPGHQRGEHRAKKRGSGMEFADHRPYVAGDDIRDMDWRTYMRLDKLLLRVFEEEADLPIYIFVDASKSMDFGQPSKFDYARKVAAALSYIGLLNLDRVSLIAFANGVIDDIASRRGRNQIWRAFGFLDRIRVGGDTSLEAALRSYFGVKRRRGLVVLLSDFLDENELDGGFRVLRYFQHDVFGIQILGAEEAMPDLPEEVTLVDAESGTSERLELTPALLQDYHEELERHTQRLEAYCTRQGWGFLRTLTAVPFEDLIVKVFRQDRFLQ